MNSINDKRIRAALEREHCPKVDIRFDTMFTLEFPRPTYLKTDEKSEAAREKNREEAREEIIGLVTENPQITTAQLATAIGITPKSVEWQIAQIRKAELIEQRLLEVERVSARKKLTWKWDIFNF